MIFFNEGFPKKHCHINIYNIIIIFNIRPVFNESEAVELQLGLTLQQIIDVVRFMCFYVAFALRKCYLRDIIGGTVIRYSLCFYQDSYNMICWKRTNEFEYLELISLSSQIRFYQERRYLLFRSEKRFQILPLSLKWEVLFMFNLISWYRLKSFYEGFLIY